MFSKKVVLGFGVAMLLVFSTVIPALASMAPEEVKMEGVVQSVDLTAGTFTLLMQDGSTVTITAPTGFDLSLLVVGDTLEAKGFAGPDGVITFTEIETQATQFEVEDASTSGPDDGAQTEVNDINDDNGGQAEVEDESNDIGDDNGGQNEVQSNDDHGSDSHQDSDSNSGSSSSHDGGSDSSSSNDD